MLKKGKVIEEIYFKFIYNSKKISVAKTKLKLDNDSVILIKGYNDMADWLYRYVNIDDNIAVSGKIDTKMEIEVEWVRILFPTEIQRK